MDCCAKGQIPTVELQELITKYQQGISDLVKKSKDHEQQIAAQKQKIMDMSITSCSDITCAITATPTCSAATFSSPSSSAVVQFSSSDPLPSLLPLISPRDALPGQSPSSSETESGRKISLTLPSA